MVIVNETARNKWNNARLVDRELALVKFEIVSEYIKDKLEQKAKGIKCYQSGKLFIQRLTKGLICPDAFNKLGRSSISLGRLYDWEKTLRESGAMDSPVALLEKKRGRCGNKSKIDTQLFSQIRKLATDKRRLQSRFIYELLMYKYETLNLEFPVGERTIRGIVSSIRKEVYGFALDKKSIVFRNKVKLHNVRINDLVAGDLWESDGHWCSFKVLSPFYANYDKGKRFLVKPKIIAWFDVATGTIVSYRVCLTENKTAVRNSLMEAISRFGIPKQIRMDNGSAYTSVEYAPLPIYNEAQGKKKLTIVQKKAIEMIDNGNYGLYGNLGIDYHFTIPGNPQSKSIEPAWKYVFGNFESWVGDKIHYSTDTFKGIENRVLIRKHRDRFLTWEALCDLLENYVTYYNNKPRAINQTIDGVKLSPLQTYNQVEHTLPSSLLLQTKMRDPYIEKRVVRQSFVEKNGIYYWHPVFASMVGEKIGFYYDEKNLQEISICNDRGQIYSENAIAITPGLQSGDDLKALIENARREKIGKLFYLAHCDSKGVAKTEKMLKLIGNELLPLSKNPQIIEYEIDSDVHDIKPKWAENKESSKVEVENPKVENCDQSHLLERAKQASINSYTPCSRIKVGAVLLCKNGLIFSGCKKENPYSGESICAESIAISDAISENVREFVALAIYTGSDTLLPPCDKCREYMAEFSDDLEIIYGNDKQMVVSSLKKIDKIIT